jgi:hypothetical protein
MSKAADIPVEQPNRFSLLINLKTTKVLEAALARLCV